MLLIHYYHQLAVTFVTLMFGVEQVVRSMLSQLFFNESAERDTLAKVNGSIVNLKKWLCSVKVTHFCKPVIKWISDGNPQEPVRATTYNDCSAPTPMTSFTYSWIADNITCTSSQHITKDNSFIIFSCSTYQWQTYKQCRVLHNFV